MFYCSPICQRSKRVVKRCVGCAGAATCNPATSARNATVRFNADDVESVRSPRKGKSESRWTLPYEVVGRSREGWGKLVCGKRGAWVCEQCLLLAVNPDAPTRHELCSPSTRGACVVACCAKHPEKIVSEVACSFWITPSRVVEFFVAVQGPAR